MSDDITERDSKCPHCGAPMEQRKHTSDKALQQNIEERDEAIDLIDDIHWQLAGAVPKGAEAWMQDALKMLWKHGRLKVDDE